MITCFIVNIGGKNFGELAAIRQIFTAKVFYYTVAIREIKAQPGVAIATSGFVQTPIATYTIKNEVCIPH